MEYIIIGLCIALLIFMILFYRITKENNILIEYKGSRISSLLAENVGLRRNIRVIEDRENKSLNEIVRIKQEINKLELKLLRKQTIKGYTSKELKQNLRFLLPDNKLAHNVRLKLDTDSGNMIGVVRKKVHGKFTDIEVEPVLISAENLVEV